MSSMTTLPIHRATANDINIANSKYAKAQSSVEFLILVGVVSIIVLSVVYVASGYPGVLSSQGQRAHQEVWNEMGVGIHSIVHNTTHTAVVVFNRLPDVVMITHLTIDDQSFPVDMFMVGAHQYGGVIIPQKISRANTIHITLWIKSNINPLGGTNITIGGYGYQPRRVGEIQLGNVTRPMENLMLWWGMDQPSWNGAAHEVVDRSGNERHGTTYGPTINTQSPINGRMAQTGIADHITYNTSIGLPGSLSISLWVNTQLDPTANIWRAVIANQQSDSGRPTLYWQTSSAEAATRRGWSVRSAAGSGDYYNLQLFQQVPFESNKWYHLVFTLNNANGHMRSYINGVLDNTRDDAVLTNGTWGASGKFTVGAAWESGETTPQHFFSGLIDEVMVFNSELSHDDVMLLYQWGFRG